MSCSHAELKTPLICATLSQYLYVGWAHHAHRFVSPKLFEYFGQLMVSCVVVFFLGRWHLNQMINNTIVQQRNSPKESHFKTYFQVYISKEFSHSQCMIIISMDSVAKVGRHSIIIDYNLSFDV